jgi:hypothetical protein
VPACPHRIGPTGHPCLSTCALGPAAPLDRRVRRVPRLPRAGQRRCSPRVPSAVTRTPRRKMATDPHPHRSVARAGRWTPRHCPPHALSRLCRPSIGTGDARSGPHTKRPARWPGRHCFPRLARLPTNPARRMSGRSHCGNDNPPTAMLRRESSDGLPPSRKGLVRGWR